MSAAPRWANGALFGAVSGLLLVLSLPKPDLHLLAWIALVPLLAALARATSWRQAAGAGYVAGLVYFAGTCYWIRETMVLYGGLGAVAAGSVGILFVAAFALYFAAFGAGVRFFMRAGTGSGLVAAPFVWVGLEFLRTCFPFGGFPWMLSGYALAPYTGFLQVASWTGIYGLSFAATGVSSLVVMAIAAGDRRWLVPGAAIVAGAWFLPAPGPVESGAAVNVRIVQANLVFDQEWRPPDGARVLEELAQLSAMGPAAPGEIRLLVWPESAGPFYLEEDEHFRSRMQSIAKENAAHFIFGYVGSTGERAANSAAVVSPAGEVVSRYDKIHLVPFGEYVPLRNALSFAEHLLNGVGNFAAGAEYTVSTLDGHPASTAICFESIFPGLVREFVRRGSELIVVITNDGWFGESSAPYQHLRMAVVRAVENRRYVVRSANTGISAVIDPYGRIEGRTPLNLRTALEGTAGFRSELTFYTRYGDVFAWANVAALAAAALYLKGRSHVRRTD
jgi:apolipoprotein N-acyltransferase